MERCLLQWNLSADGEPFETKTSDLLPVLCADGAPGIVKLAKCEDEMLGNSLMAWWGGEGAARVIAQEGPAILLERAVGNRSLAEMDDGAASTIICEVAANLHATRLKPLPRLVPLEIWFAELTPAAAKYGGVLKKSLDVSRHLLAAPRDCAVLHGDLHHGNVLDGGVRGWLAIDPKALWGERGFDFANIFCNPDMQTATAPGRLAEQIGTVTAAAGLDRLRLLQWILAYAGLSAAWSLNSPADDPQCALAIAEIASQYN